MALQEMFQTPTHIIYKRWALTRQPDICSSALSPSHCTTISSTAKDGSAGSGQAISGVKVVGIDALSSLGMFLLFSYVSCHIVNV